jgi:hypothetical protein
MTFIRFACLIPILLWIGLEAYVDQFEVWGQWAAAPILIYKYFFKQSDKRLTDSAS